MNSVDTVFLGVVFLGVVSLEVGRYFSEIGCNRKLATYFCDSVYNIKLENLFYFYNNKNSYFWKLCFSQWCWEPDFCESGT